MEVRNAHRILIESKEYKDWKNKNKDYFLVNAFVILENGENIIDVQFGFTNEKGEKITSFIICNGVKEVFDDELFKRPKDKVEELVLDDVNVKIKGALEIANKANEEKYPSEVANKKILILDRNGWNVTFITDTFSMINFKIDFAGGLISSEKKSLLSLGSNGS